MSEVRWYKGNLHTHTNKSDGDASPEKVARWYGRHGYDFLTLSDHDRLTRLGRLRGKTEATIPLLIPGEELQVSLSGGDMVIHLNAIGISKQVDPIIVKEVTSGIQTNVNTILDAGGIASINHPNYSWALDHETIARITGVSLVEVFNGEPAVNMYAAPGRENYEQIWDGVLSTGRLIYGVATDDAHNYLDFSLGLSNPGRGWVMVHAPHLTQEAIVKALASGSFYASTGVALPHLVLSQEAIYLEIEQDWDYLYTTTFTGHEGVTLAESVGLEAKYCVRGDEGYVRATVRSSYGTKAWTQPVWLK